MEKWIWWEWLQPGNSGVRNWFLRGKLQFVLERAKSFRESPFFWDPYYLA